MLDLQHLVSSSRADVQVFVGSAVNIDVGHFTWNKPRGVSMAYMIAVGAGGPGGNGAVGAASTAAGGGGGGGGGQTTLLIPTIFLPDVLYVQTGYSGGTAHTKVSVSPRFTVVNEIILYAQFANGAGGNASGATAGTGGVGGNIVTIATSCLSGLGRYQFFAGQAGTNGGTTGAGNDLALPTTGLIVTGGAGGAGLASGNGGAGGRITGAGPLQTLAGGIGAINATTPPTYGSSGISPITGLLYNYGGTGGGATSGIATGAGLVGAYGGNGAPGCGGGGGGGALTGSTQGLGGRGGPGFVIIIAW